MAEPTGSRLDIELPKRRHPVPGETADVSLGQYVANNMANYLSWTLTHVRRPAKSPLELLRNIRADLAGVRGQIERLYQRMERMDPRLSMIDQLLGNMYALTGRDRETLLALERRVEQLERSAAQADG